MHTCLVNWDRAAEGAGTMIHLDGSNGRYGFQGSAPCWPHNTHLCRMRYLVPGWHAGCGWAWRCRCCLLLCRLLSGGRHVSFLDGERVSWPFYQVTLVSVMEEQSRSAASVQRGRRLWYIHPLSGGV